ncbi:MAG: hypothetical protein P4L40_08520 [Terracidiphilus sp.]|nr:hypothetical protein [Terracidiphilus sp.]
MPAGFICAIVTCARSLQIEAEEVVLRRTIGATKDSYFLNGKSVTKVRPFRGCYRQ